MRDPLERMTRVEGEPPHMEKGTEGFIDPTPRRLPTAQVKWLGGQDFRLRADYTVLDDRHGVRFVIPAGFMFDAASVPRPVWMLISALDCGKIATLAHDWLYEKGGVLPERTYTRYEADVLFLDLMREEGVPTWRAQAAYRAVRMFGGSAWQTPIKEAA